MKRILKRILKVFSVLILVSLALFMWAVRIVRRDNIREMSAGMLRGAGIDFVTYYWDRDHGLSYDTFPHDNKQSESEQIAFMQERWHLLKTERAQTYAYKYYDPEIWTVIKNIPDNPPDNLIVLATRNIDASSLRTKLTAKDMDKCIRIDEHFIPPENLPILKTIAVVVNASRGTSLFSTNPGYHQKFRRIYLNWSPRKPSKEPEPFDLTTNLVNGLQVKYLTTDGEVIPTND